MDHSSTSSKSSRRSRPSKPPSYGSSGSGQNLHLSSLPRFHPANFNSASSSMSSTPKSSLTSPNGSTSPRGASRYFDPDQRELSYYHQMLTQSAVGGASATSMSKKPNSPKIHPLTSSGPVTPLELEGDSYLTSGGSNKKNQLSIDALIREEARRRGELSPPQPST